MKLTSSISRLGYSTDTVRYCTLFAAFSISTSTLSALLFRCTRLTQSDGSEPAPTKHWIQSICCANHLVVHCRLSATGVSVLFDKTIIDMEIRPTTKYFQLHWFRMQISKCLAPTLVPVSLFTRTRSNKQVQCTLDTLNALLLVRNSTQKVS